MSPLFIGAANSTNRLLGNQSSNPSSPQAGDRYIILLIMNCAFMMEVIGLR